MIVQYVTLLCGCEWMRAPARENAHPEGRRHRQRVAQLTYRLARYIVHARPGHSVPRMEREGRSPGAWRWRPRAGSAALTAVRQCAVRRTTRTTGGEAWAFSGAIATRRRTRSRPAH